MVGNIGNNEPLRRMTPASFCSRSLCRLLEPAPGPGSTAFQTPRLPMRDATSRWQDYSARISEDNDRC